MANIFGTEASEVLVGTQEADRFWGRGGHDTIYGYGGNDYFNSEEFYGVFNNRWEGGDGNDVMELNRGNDTLLGGNGIDTLQLTYGTNYYIMVDLLETQAYATGIGTKIIRGFENIDFSDGTGRHTIRGNDGDNHIIAGQTANAINGRAGNDTIVTAGGSDTIYGQTGDDTLIIRSASARVWANLGAGQDTVEIDMFAVEGGALKINALEAGAAVSTPANSTVNVIGAERFWADHWHSREDGFQLSLTGASAAEYVEISMFFSDAGLRDSLDVRMGAGNDTIQVSSSSVRNPVRIEGGSGNDFINLTSHSGNSTIFGGEGNDTVTIRDGYRPDDAPAQSDIIRLDGGNDFARVQLDGRATVEGGAGNDTISFYAALGGVVDGGDGDDIIRIVNSEISASLIGGSGNDAIYGARGADTISGGAGNDTINGNDGGDYINGGAGSDVIDAGYGNDTVILSAGGDTLVGGQGLDLLNVSTQTVGLFVNLGAAGVQTFAAGVQARITGFENVMAGNGADTLFGDLFNNLLNGGAGNDSLVGGAGDDTLVGGAGADVINGGAGADRLTGGAQGDLFVFSPGGDTITDFDVNLDRFQIGITRAQAEAALDDASIQAWGARVNFGGNFVNFVGIQDADLLLDRMVFV